MTSPRACPTCKSPVPADAPGGACPRCLMAIAFATDAGAMTPDVAPADVAQRFPGYEVTGTIGRGGMGVVFRARQKALDREVALKVLPAGPSRPAGFTERFEREAKALARLQHSGIVQVFDFGTSADGWCYLAMELVDGVNLRRALADGRLAPKQALAIVPQICDALQYAHDHGVVHRDIKPENLLLTKDGRVKVADFGLVKLVEDARGGSLTHTGHTMGTPLYMAPEQVEHPGDVDHRADIYSLGVVFYEMLTGELPIGRFAVPSKKTDVDARIDDIVLRTLEKERDARFQRVDEVKTRIDEAAVQPPPLPAAARVPVMDAVAEKTTELHQAWFTRRSPESRVSKFALLMPLAAIAAFVIADVNAGSGWDTFGVTAPSILVLLLASLVAWGRIRRSAGRLYGLGFAALGVFGALVLVPWTLFLCLDRSSRTQAQYVPPVIGAQRRTKPPVVGGMAPRIVEGVEVPPGVPDDHVDDWVQGPRIAALARRLQAVFPLEDFLVADMFFASADVETLQAMPAELRASKAAEGAIGLPCLAASTLGAPLSEFTVVRHTVSGDRGTVCLEHAKLRARLVAHVERLPGATPDARRWVFSLAPVERSEIAAESWPPPDPNDPMSDK